MPDPRFAPNDSRYYEKPLSYPALELLITGAHRPTDPQELKEYNANRENLEAFLRSQVISQTETPEQIRKVFYDVPGFRAKDIQQDARRQLSEIAREKIIEFVLHIRLAGEGIGFAERNYNMLLRHGDSEEARQYNENIVELLNSGMPSVRGRLFDAYIKECKSWAEKCVKGMSDRELVENLTSLQKVQQLGLNVNSIRNLAKNGEIKLSGESQEILNYINSYSAEINAAMHRVSAIANPTYQYIDIDGFLSLSSEQFEQMQESVDNLCPGMSEFLKNINNVRGNDFIARNENKAGLKAALQEVAEANKGFFIGSMAYSRAFRSMRNLDKMLDKMAEYPSDEALEAIRPMLQETMGKCQDYLESKKPSSMNRRARIRVKAMKHGMEKCQKLLDYLDKKQRVKNAEEMKFSRPGMNLKYPYHPYEKVSQKILDSYGDTRKLSNGTVIDATISKSNVGTAADNLRKEIARDLTRLTFGGKAFNPDLAKDTIAKMVVLEMVKRSRGTDEKGDIIAGSIECKLADDHDGMIESFRGNKYIQRFTDDVSEAMLRHFVMEDGAKNITDHLLRMINQPQSAPDSQPTQQIERQSIPNNPQ